MSETLCKYCDPQRNCMCTDVYCGECLGLLLDFELFADELDALIRKHVPDLNDTQVSQLVIMFGRSVEQTMKNN